MKKSDPIGAKGLEPAQDETVPGLVRDLAAKGEESALAGGGIEILNSVPMDPVRTQRNMIEIGGADQGPQVALIVGKFLAGGGVLLGGPSRGVLHDRAPAHHAAAEHVPERLQRGRGIIGHITFEHGRGKHATRVVKGLAVRERIVRVGDREIVHVRGRAEVHHPSAIVASLQQQIGMLAA